MRLFVLALALASAVHAINCTDAIMSYYKGWYGIYFDLDDAVLDSSYKQHQESYATTKYIREKNIIKQIYSDYWNGEYFQESNFMYVFNDLSAPIDSGVVYQKSYLGDTLFVEAIIKEYVPKKEGVRTTNMTMKILKDWLLLAEEEHEPWKEDISSVGYIELFVKNDTLFRIHYGSNDGTSFDTIKFQFDFASETDDHVCRNFSKEYSCSGYCTDEHGNASHNGDVQQLADWTVIENDSGFVVGYGDDDDLMQYFMVYRDGKPTSIAKPLVKRPNSVRHTPYFDPKGRKHSKTLPYRVMF